MLTKWVLAFCLGIVSCSEFTVVEQWQYIDYEFRSSEEREAAISSGNYEKTAGFPIDVDHWNGKTFVTVIRSPGVPSSLNVISRRVGEGGPLLRPYPDWSWTTTNCSGIVSVYRVAIDRCNRIWVLDTGKIDSTKVCSAQLLIFDLHTSKLVKRVIIPDNIANDENGNGTLVTPVLEVHGQHCESVTAYLGDPDGHAIIVYNMADSSLERVTSSALLNDPRATTYTIEGQSFELTDGPVGMAFSHLTHKLYLSPMSSYNLVSVPTRYFRLYRGDQVPFQVNNIFPTQASAKAISKKGALFFGLVNSTSIGCWNEFREPSKDNVVTVARNPETLQFTSGMKIKKFSSRTGTREKLLILTNRYQKLATGTMNPNEVNFRIQVADVDKLIANTLCMPP